MAAGQGFKTFTTGEVLTAGDVNGYLMQGINVFTNATARDAAITAPAEGQFAFTKDNNSLWYYDGAAWVASGATGDIEGVTAGVGISGGGTSGTVTVTNSMATAIDAKGDLVPGTGADTFARLAVGANDTVLTADSSTATGLKWATPAAGFTNPMTTTGDTIYSSPGSTPVRLGIGSTGQVLTVAGGVPSWATAASPAANFSLISTTTTNSGSTITFSSLSSYNQLIFTFTDVSTTTDSILKLGFNSDGAVTTYNAWGIKTVGSSSYSTGILSGFDSVDTSEIQISRTGSTSATVQGTVTIENTKTSGFKTGSINAIPNNLTAGRQGFMSNFVYANTSVISSVRIYLNDGTFDGGTIRLYGSTV